jgi:hypothetical protein
MQLSLAKEEQTGRWAGDLLPTACLRNNPAIKKKWAVSWFSQGQNITRFEVKKGLKKDHKKIRVSGNIKRL